VALDGGDTATVAARLAEHVLSKEAAREAMSLPALMALPVGKRRFYHDDLTIVVAFLNQ
jgi:hypothetical protein